MTNPSDGPTYTAPPIIEAIIQLVYAEPLASNDHERLVKRLKRRYANELPSHQVNVQVDFQKRTARFEESPQSRLSSSDEADVLVILPISLTWSRLAPYEGWDKFFDRVSVELADAAGQIGYRKLTRIGVRYVNRISVPISGDVTRYEDYLTINIDVPKEWPTIDNYGWRFEKNFGDHLAIVQSAIIEPDVPQTAAFLLDIDVILGERPGVTIPQKVPEILAALLPMRDLKNEIFEISITDLARESFRI